MLLKWKKRRNRSKEGIELKENFIQNFGAVLNDRPVTVSLSNRRSNNTVLKTFIDDDNHGKLVSK